MALLPSGRIVGGAMAKQLELRRAKVARKNPPKASVRLAESRFGRLAGDSVLRLARDWSEAERASLSERRGKQAKAWREANPERWRETLRRWQRENRARWIKWPRRPSWADASAIREIYKFARLTGMHVDHVIPLNGSNVCGLHTPTNLQLLPPVENMAKGNRYAA